MKFIIRVQSDGKAVSMMLGNRIRQLRKSKHLTQQDVADHLKLAKSTISQYETGTNEPDAKTISQLAELFGVSTDYLITGKAKTDANSDIPREEQEFLDWVRDNLEGTFFYDFSKSPEEQKQEMMRSLRIIWELEKNRKPGQKQGE